MTIPVSNEKKVYVAVDGGGISNTNNKGDYSISFKLQQ